MRDNRKKHKRTNKNTTPDSLEEKSSKETKRPPPSDQSIGAHEAPPGLNAEDSSATSKDEDEGGAHDLSVSLDPDSLMNGDPPRFSQQDREIIELIFNTGPHDKKYSEDARHSAKLFQFMIENLARHYTEDREEQNDFRQEGLTGLLLSLKTFDKAKNIPLATHAFGYIQRRMSVFKSKSGLIRIPEKKRTKMNKVRHYIEDFQKREEHDPAVEDIARQTKMSVDSVKSAQAASRMAQTSSLNESVGNDGDPEDELANLATEPESIEVEYRIQNVRNHQMLAEALDCLSSERARDMVELHFGWIDGAPWTLEAIGRKFGVAKQSVDEQLKRSIAKLREHLERLYPGTSF